MALVCLIPVTCKTSEKEAVWEPDVYKGEPEKLAIVRSGDEGEREIKCESREFSTYICINEADMERLLKACLKK